MRANREIEGIGPGPVGPAGTVRPGERGTALVTLALSIVALLGFAALAIDVAMLYTVRNQLQNAADSAALAGASGRIESDQEARVRAIGFAGSNDALNEAVVIAAADVAFPAERRVRVITHRAQNTADPVPLFFARVLGFDLADVRALAEAEYYATCGTDCFKPWSPMDRFFDGDSNGVFNPENGVDFYDPVTTGYQPPQDVGLQITLKIADPHDVPAPSYFFAVDFPPVNKGRPITGAAEYRRNIAQCNPSIIEVGDTLQVEPGNMIGPTRQGVDQLIARDPGAYWDGDHIEGSRFPGFTSPRVVKIALFDPNSWPVPGRNNVYVIKTAAFFLEDTPGNDVLGRFLQIVTPGGVPCEDPSDPSFLTSLRLVR